MSLYTFLKDRGIAEETVQHLEDEKIDEYVLLEMDEVSLRQFIPKYGDRVAAFRYCKQKVQSVDDTKQVENITQRIKDKLQGTDDKKIKKVKGRVKDLLRIEMGWMHFSSKEKRYVQVRQTNGGGTRHLKVNRNDNMAALKELGKTFFKAGMERKRGDGRLDFAMCNFCGEIVDENLTVVQMYEDTQLKMIRVYVGTKQLQSTAEHSEITEEEKTDQDGEREIIHDEQQAATNSNEDSEEGDELDLPDIVYQLRTREGPTLTSNQCSTSSGQHPSAESPVTCSSPRYTAAGTPTVLFKMDSNPEMEPREATSLYEILLGMSTCINVDEKKNIVNVTRHDILDGGYRAFLRKSFNPNHLLSVKFAGEQGMDTGGPTREFLSLAMKEIFNSGLFEGESNAKYLTLSATDLERNSYKAAGMLIAYSIVHRGPLPTIFAPFFYEALQNGPDQVDIPIAALPEPQRGYLSELLHTKECDFIASLDSLLSTIQLAGCSGLMVFRKRKELVNHLKFFIIFGRLKAALDQFLEGLSILGVLDTIRKYPVIMREAFLTVNRSLTAELVADTIPVKIETWSPPGSNRRRAEAQTHGFWLDYLQDVEEEENSEGLQKVLQFVTGATEIPVLGFPVQAQLLFRHMKPDANDPTSEFPIASTCALTLSLPILNNFAIFKARMNAAVSVEMFTME